MPHQKTSCKLIASVLCVSFTHISHMFNSHSFKKILNSLFYSIFQRHGEKNLKPDLESPGNILQSHSDYYDWLLRFRDTNNDFPTTYPYSLFYIKFYGQKNMIMVIPIKDGHSNQRCSRLWINICIWEQRLCCLLRFANSYTFLFYLNLLDIPLAYHLLIVCVLTSVYVYVPLIYCVLTCVTFWSHSWFTMFL